MKHQGAWVLLGEAWPQAGRILRLIARAHLPPKPALGMLTGLMRIACAARPDTALFSAQTATEWQHGAKFPVYKKSFVSAY